MKPDYTILFSVWRFHWCKHDDGWYFLMWDVPGEPWMHRFPRAR